MDEEIKSKLTKDVFDILVKNNVKCFLTGGALLGAYRDNGNLPSESYKGGNFNVIESQLILKFSMIKTDLAKKGYNSKICNKKRTMALLVGIKKGCRVEIIGYFKKGNKYFRIARYLKVIPEDFFEKPFSEITLLDNKYPAPYDVKKYLEWIYIDWKIPNKLTVEKGMKNDKHIVKYGEGI